jgi:hypothetical protein
VFVITALDTDPGVNPGRGSNVSEFTRILSDEVLAPAIAAGVRPYLVSVSVIGEKKDGTNTKVGPAGDRELNAFAAAQESIAEKFNIPFVNVRKEYQAYDAKHNCLDMEAGLLTADGVHPVDGGGRGAMLLANAHAEALLMLLKQEKVPSMPPKPPPKAPPNPTLCGTECIYQDIIGSATISSSLHD